jgi:hypothetical protein
MNEYPKESGWYWFKEWPNTPWKPVHVFLFNDKPVFNHDRGTGGILKVTELWQNQWGTKIEEPKS